MSGRIPDGRIETVVLIGVEEKLCLLGRSNGNALERPEPSPDTVPLEQASGHLISLELRVLDSGTFLVVKNHHLAPLRYRAVMHVPGSSRAAATSTCPVMPGLAGIEHWPHAIDALMVGDFEMLEPGDALDCRCGNCRASLMMSR